MTVWTCVRYLAWLAVLGLVSACSGHSTRPAPEATAAAPVPERDLIAEVRARAAAADDSIEVQPLLDPVAVDLREAAAMHERHGDLRAADAALVQALELVPDAPELLQWRAELALAMGRLDDAVQLANASWELGPRVGNLCRRNWIAIQLARELSQLPDASALAAAQGERCTAAAPVRM